MLDIKTQSGVSKTLFTKLIELVEQAGGEFHPSLQLDVRGSEASFSLKKSVQPDQQLVQLPPSCMPAFDRYEWALENGRLTWSLSADAANFANDFSSAELAVHDEIVEVSLELYNHLDKVEAFAEVSPVVQLQSYEHLFRALFEAARDEHLWEVTERGSDALKIYSFWQNRLFVSINTKRQHLIPVMEFFNHHIFAKSFGWGALNNNQRPLGLLHQPVDPKNKRLAFACYEIMDALHSYTKYAFVDQQAFFVQSQPFRIELKDGVCLTVAHGSVTTNQCYLHEWERDPKYQNSLMYRSRLSQSKSDYELAYMLIPPARHLPAFEDALLAQLVQIERKESLVHGTISDRATLQQIKRTMFSETLASYRRISEALESCGELNRGVASDIRAMLKHQSAILKDFKKTLAS